ncbi:MAG: hypothetical protein NVS3B24_03200 [Candidatus Dormibacteria bacterium]
MKGTTALRLLVVLGLCAAALGTSTGVSAGDPGTAYTLFQLTNQDRTSNGLGALAFNAYLANIATSAQAGSCGSPRGRSQDLIDRNYFSHQIPPCGGYVWDVFNLGAYNSAGENIGWNNYPPADSVGQINTAFMNSPEHRANILGNYNQLGTGAWQATGPWSGAGGPYNNVIMYTEIFINAPSGGGGAPPPPPPPPPPPSRPPPAPAPRPAPNPGTAPAPVVAPAQATPDQPAVATDQPAPPTDQPAAPTAAPVPTPSVPTCPVPTEIGEADRTSPAPTLPSDGGPAPCPTPNLVGAAPSSGPSVASLTGSIDAGSRRLTLSMSGVASVGDSVTVAGAGDAGAEFVARVVGVKDAVVVLDTAAKTSVKAAPVKVRAAAEVRGSDREAAHRGILETVVDQVLRLFLNV